MAKRAPLDLHPKVRASALAGIAVIVAGAILASLHQLGVEPPTLIGTILGVIVSVGAGYAKEAD